jgi:hypothetical protein
MHPLQNYHINLSHQLHPTTSNVLLKSIQSIALFKSPGEQICEKVLLLTQQAGIPVLLLVFPFTSSCLYAFKGIRLSDLVRTSE